MTPEQALEIVISNNIGGLLRNKLLMQHGPNMEETAHRILTACVADAQKWRANKEAVRCANDMLQAARPTILNMLRMEKAAKEAV